MAILNVSDIFVKTVELRENYINSVQTFSSRYSLEHTGGNPTELVFGSGEGAKLKFKCRREDISVFTDSVVNNIITSDITIITNIAMEDISNHNIAVIRIPRKVSISTEVSTDDTTYDFIVMSANSLSNYLGLSGEINGVIQYTNIDELIGGAWNSRPTSTSILYEGSFLPIIHKLTDRDTVLDLNAYTSDGRQGLETLANRINLYIQRDNNGFIYPQSGLNKFVSVVESDFPVFDVRDTDAILNWYNNGDDSGKIEPNEGNPDDPYITPETPSEVFTWTKKGFSVDIFTGSNTGYGNDSLTHKFVWSNSQLDNAPQIYRDTVRMVIKARRQLGDGTYSEYIVYNGGYSTKSVSISLRSAFGLTPTEIPSSDYVEFQMYLVSVNDIHNHGTIVTLHGRFNAEKIGGFEYSNASTEYDNRIVAMRQFDTTETIDEISYNVRYYLDNDHESGSDLYCSAKVHYRAYLVHDEDTTPDRPEHPTDLNPFIPDLPGIFSTEGIKTYRVNGNTLKWMEKELFSGDISSTFTSNMLACILSAKAIPCLASSKTGATNRLYLGNKILDNGEESSVVLEVDRFKQFTSSVTIDVPSPYSGNEWQLDYLDYEPYSNLKLYLPFTSNGWYDIPLSAVRGKTLNVRYSIDFVSGDIKYYILVGGVPLITITGNCSVDIPFNTDHNADRVLNQLSGAIKLGSSTVSGAVSGASVGGVGGAVVGAVGSIISNFETVLPKWNYESTGISSSLNNMYTPLSIIMYYEYPRTVLTKSQTNYKHYNGRPLMQTRVLSTLSGYTEVSNVELKNVTCTEEEKNEIIALMQSGVYL